MGLSPRGRGSLDVGEWLSRSSGSIPARAGEPHFLDAGHAADWVYPRAGGGAIFGAARIAHDLGLSPRGRGSRYSTPAARIASGSIPARAGEPAGPSALRTFGGVYPRAGGGAEFRDVVDERLQGLSPRGRGSPQTSASELNAAGSIPARAGEPWRAGLSLPTRRVYPRAGGGARYRIAESHPELGLSPRGRGSQHPARELAADPGSIPARAGEPLPTNLLIHLHCQRAVAHRIALTAVLREERRPRPRCP